MPAAANRQTQAHPTPGGRGNKSSKQIDKSRGEEGAGREEEKNERKQRAAHHLIHHLITPARRA